MHAPLTPAYRVEWRTLAALQPVVEHWRSLAARALEPNVFYDPAFALAAAPVFGGRCGAVLVWTMHGRLVGLFPARKSRWRDGALPVLTGWTHPYAPLGTPLVDRDDPEPVIAAWLAHLAHDPAMPPLLMLPMLPEHGRFASALATVLTQKGIPTATFGAHRRAMLEVGDQRDPLVERLVPARKRKELQRQRRRLEDIAPVTFNMAHEHGRIGPAIEDFLVLEASGWKGVAQTAAANDPAVRRFVETAVTALAAQGQARVDRMMFGDKAIAAAITLTAGNTAWFWKTAYNEGVARFSPGVQIAYQLTPSLASLPGIARVDSCATADHPMIDHMWHDRLALCDRLIAVKATWLPFSAVRAVEALRRSAIETVKAARTRLQFRDAKLRPRAQQTADHLAGGGHRHLGDEIDLARILVRGQPGPDKRLNVGGKRV